LDEVQQVLAQVPVGNKVVLWFRSPGGVVTGTQETGAVLREFASGREVVAFTDDDCVVDSRWLESIAAAFEDPRVGISGGPDLTYVENTTPVGLAAGHIHYFYRLLATKSGADAVIGCNSAYRRSAALEARGFEDSLVGAEDTPLHRRILDMGYTMRPHPQAIVYHKRRAKFGTLVKRYWTYGWHMGLAHRRNPGAFKERRRHIYALLGGVVALALLVGLSVLFPFLAWAFPALALSYFVFQFTLHRYLIKKTGFSSPFWTFLAASTLCMIAFAAAFAKEQVLPRKLKHQKVQA
ncbi:MAG: glycosyltransferase family 2 protein, partial [Chloroflexota bacterium]